MKIYGIDCPHNNCSDARSRKCFSCKQNTDLNKNNLSKYIPDKLDFVSTATEIKKCVNVFRIEKRCEKCGGKLDYTGKILYCYPPKFPHKCVDCELIVNFDRTYPAIVYEDKQD